MKARIRGCAGSREARLGARDFQCLLKQWPGFRQERKVVAGRGFEQMPALGHEFIVLGGGAKEFSDWLSLEPNGEAVVFVRKKVSQTHRRHDGLALDAGRAALSECTNLLHGSHRGVAREGG